MIITVDKADALPLYEQLRRQIIAGLARGELEPGDMLPSVRRLAKDLGINLHTVNKAYAMLRDEGHIVMRRGSGAMVAPRDVGSLSQQHDREMRRMRDDIYRIAIEYKAHGGSLDEFMADVKHNASAVFRTKPSTGPGVMPTIKKRRRGSDDELDDGRNNCVGGRQCGSRSLGGASHGVLRGEHTGFGATRPWDQTCENRIYRLCRIGKRDGGSRKRRLPGVVGSPRRNHCGDHNVVAVDRGLIRADCEVSQAHHANQT